MKISIKTLKGTHFEVQVKPEDTIADVKMKIEKLHGPDVYPCSQQMLIHQGKVLKDASTLQEYKVCENDFFVIMLSKTKSSSSGVSTTIVPQTEPAANSSPTPVLEPAVQAPTVAASPPSAVSIPFPAAPTTAAAPIPTLTGDVYGQAASNLVAGSNFEEAVQQILDVGGGSWDRDTVVRALRAAYNNPERAIEYLYAGIPEQAEVPPVARPTNVPAAQAPQPTLTTPIPSSVPNANPLDLFPQGIPNVEPAAGAGTLDFLRNSQQFQMLRAMVQANPEILQPMLQELGKQNPHLVRLIQEHQADFLRLLNEPIEGADSNLLGQLAAEMPQAVTVTPEEREAIERLEAMGFDRAIVLQVFFACNKNEELAANYLLDHMHEFEE